MTNRPHLAIFALCIAGIIGLGLALVFAAFGQPIPGWWLSGLGVFVFLGVTAVGIQQDWAIRDSEDKARTDALKVTTAERAWALTQAQSVALPAPEPEPDDDTQLDHAWAVAAHRFVTAGHRHGFQVRILADDDSPHKVISWDGWGIMRGVLVGAGVLTRLGGTRWQAGWSWEKWQEERAALVLPYPKGQNPPEVDLPGHNATNTTANTVLEGVVSGERA